MFLDPGKLFIREGSRGHVLIGNAVIGQHGRGQFSFRIHHRQPGQVHFRQFRTALPERLQLLRCPGPQPGQDFLRFRQKERPVLRGKAVIDPHFLGRSQNDAHQPRASSRLAASAAAFTLSSARIIVPSSLIRYVVRTTPMEVFPYSFFSFQTS